MHVQSLEASQNPKTNNPEPGINNPEPQNEKPLGIAHAYLILLCICVYTSMYEQSIQRGILAQDYLQTECSLDWYVRAETNSAYLKLVLVFKGCHSVSFLRIVASLAIS